MSTFDSIEKYLPGESRQTKLDYYGRHILPLLSKTKGPLLADMNSPHTMRIQPYPYTKTPSKSKTNRNAGLAAGATLAGLAGGGAMVAALIRRRRRKQRK
jgi:hypothetical protein